MRLPTAVHTAAHRLCSGKVATPIELTAGTITLGQRQTVVRCPWHKWEFDIATGRCLVDQRLRVRRYPVRIVGEEIVVMLSEPMPTHSPARADAAV